LLQQKRVWSVYKSRNYVAVAKFIAKKFDPRFGESSSQSDVIFNSILCTYGKVMTSSAVSYKSSAFHSKMSESNKLDTESRDLKAQCDQQRKELERKDLRNQNTSKEMQQVRSSFADLQVHFTYLRC